MSPSNVLIPLLLTFLAGLSTGLGSLVSFFIKDFKKSYLQFFLGLSAGVMIYIAFAELLAAAIGALGFFGGNAAFFGGIFFIMLVDFLIPHDYLEEHLHHGVIDKKLHGTGMLTAIGVGIHNFPEGLAVFMSSITDLKLGIPLAIAIAIHNIPEGIAVSVPVLYATHSRKKAFWYSFLSGIVEPIAALLAIFFLLPFLTPEILAGCLGAVAGIMVFISFDELLPLSFAEDGHHISIFGIILGMLLMAGSLSLIQ